MGQLGETPEGRLSTVIPSGRRKSAALSEVSETGAGALKAAGAKKARDKMVCISIVEILEIR